MVLWEYAVVSVLFLALAYCLWRVYDPPEPVAAQTGPQDRAAAPKCGDRWEILERAAGGETFDQLRIDADGLHAFWRVATARGVGVRFRVLRGCLEGRVGDEPAVSAGVAAFAPFDGGAVLFDSRGGAHLTIAENEACGPEILSFATAADAGDDAAGAFGPPDVDLSGATRSHCGGWMRAAVVAPRGRDLVRVDLTSGAFSTLAVAEGPIISAALSGDGAAAAYFVGRDLMLWRRGAAAAPARLWRADAGLVGRPVFFGKELYFATRERVLSVDWEAPGEPRVRYLAPDDEAIDAYCVGGDGSVYAARNGDVHPLPGGAPAPIAEMAVAGDGALYALGDGGVLLKYAGAAR